MKQFITFLLLFVPLLAQNNMTIHFDDGTTISKKVASIDSITFDKAPIIDRLPVGTWMVTGIFNADSPTENILSDIRTNLGHSDYTLALGCDPDGSLLHTLTPLVLYLVFGEENMTKLAPIEPLLSHYNDSIFDQAFLEIHQNPESGILQFLFEPPNLHDFLMKFELIGADTRTVRNYLLFMFSRFNMRQTEDSMVWEFTNSTDAEYRNNLTYMDETWLGWESSRFTRCRVEFTKIQEN